MCAREALVLLVPQGPVKSACDSTYIFVKMWWGTLADILRVPKQTLVQVKNKASISLVSCSILYNQTAPLTTRASILSQTKMVLFSVAILGWATPSHGIIMSAHENQSPHHFLRRQLFLNICMFTSFPCFVECLLPIITSRTHPWHNYTHHAWLCHGEVSCWLANTACTWQTLAQTLGP